MNRETWSADLRLAGSELWRVLKMGGVLVFKWNNHDIKFKSVLRLFPERPLFGQISAGAKKRDGKPGHTCWFCFLKVKRHEDPQRTEEPFLGLPVVIDTSIPQDRAYLMESTGKEVIS
jgi:hypothetical protein